MIELMTDMPEGTLGFKISGELTRKEYADVLAPALRGPVERGERVRALYLIDDLEEMEPGALWEDTKTGFDLGIRHHGSIERSAFVTDLHWLVRAARLFGWMAPGELQIFPTAELDAAKHWIAS